MLWLSLTQCIIAQSKLQTPYIKEAETKEQTSTDCTSQGSVIFALAR